LAPTPYRGKRNESAYIVNVLEKLADIHSVPNEQIALETTKNSKEVFGI
jgi:TatD DNase family protein